MYDYILNYNRALHFARLCMKGNGDEDSECLMWMMGYVDNLMEVELLEDQIMELGRS